MKKALRFFFCVITATIMMVFAWRDIMPQRELDIWSWRLWAGWLLVWIAADVWAARWERDK